MTDLRWKNNAFGLDVSSIQKVIDYKGLKAAGVDFIIARATHGTWALKNVSDPAVAIDPMFDTHCQGAYDAGLIFGAYSVFDPFIDPDPVDPTQDRQIKPIIKAIGNKIGKSVNFWALDTEIYKQYDGVIATNYQISSRSGQMVNRMRALYPGFKVGVYSGQWFVDAYAKDMYAWMDSYAKQWDMFKWLARYPSDTDAPEGSIYPATIADFKGGKYSPVWPETKSFPWFGDNAADIWQFTGDKFTVAGHYGENASKLSSIDGNFFNGTPAQMKAWCGYVDRGIDIVPDPDPIDPDPVDPGEEETQPVDLSGVNAKLDTILQKLAKLEWLAK
jgi:GH25 family lysozyme M1 (1,4-beta-N-acetylmuramidase)